MPNGELTVSVGGIKMFSWMFLDVINTPNYFNCGIHVQVHFQIPSTPLLIKQW